VGKTVDIQISAHGTFLE